ncbi:MAG: hypothetical protein MR602_09825, partial [Bacteroidales bacterium]|nr:hypothetical protein [Bacteroidales bacterium]
SNSFHTKKRFPKNRENASIAVIFFQKNAPCPQKSPKNTYIFSAFDTSRPRQMIDNQYGITIMGGREVSRPYRVFRRRRVVFILLAMPLPSLERATLVMWCG